MNNSIALRMTPGSTVYSIRYGRMNVEEVKFETFGREIFGIIVNATTNNGKKLLHCDSGVDSNRALFDIHELLDVPMFSAWWRDVLDLARDRFYIDDRMRPTVDYWLCFLLRLFPEEAIRHVEEIE